MEEQIQPTIGIEPVKKKSKWWLWLIIILIVIGIGVGAYFMFSSGGGLKEEFLVHLLCLIKIKV